MEKKYFETKTGSLEEKITQIATEQQSIKKQEPNVKLETKSYFETKPGSISDAASKIVSEALDPVNKDAVKKKFDDRQDKDIDNDGDTDSTDKYLHKRRAAISKNIKKEAVDNPDAVGMAQAMKSKNDKPPLEKSTITKAHDIAKSIMKKEETCPKCGKDHANKINASNCGGMRENKSFSQLRTETKVIKLGDKGKTATGKDAASVDVEPSAKPI